MALISCPDCGNSVSDQAELCRNCGRPIKNQVHQRLKPEEIELDLFNPHEAEMLRKQVVENESSLNKGLTPKEKEEKKRKKRRADLIKKIQQWAIIILLTVIVFSLRRKIFS